jgi:type I restriction enzyme S subunit
MAMWQTSPLTSACTVFADGDWLESKDQSLAGVRLVQTGNVGEGDFKDRAEKARFISHDTFTRLRCTEIFAGDCLISRLPDPVGRACLIPETGERMVTAVDCTIARFDQSKLLPEFFVYYTQSGDYLAAVERDATGTTRKRISRARLGQIPIPLAPLFEQRRIVAILDEAFEGIATAKAHAEKNLRNAREVFNSALDGALSRLGHGYVETTLGHEAEVLAGYAFPSKGYVAAANGVRLLRGDNIMQGFLRWEDAKAWPATDLAPYERFALRAGDVVLAMDRPWVKAGLKRAKLGVGDLPTLLLQRTARLRPRERMTEDFLFRLTGSDSFSRHLLALQTGIGVPHISGKQIESYRFALPPMEAQRTIALALDEMDRQSQRLADNYQRKLAALDELKKSLLHQAFSGAL